MSPRLRALNTESSGHGSSPGRGHCILFLDKTLYFNSAGLHLCVSGYQGMHCFEVTLRWTSTPSRGSRNTTCDFMRQTLERELCWSDGPRGSVMQTFSLPFDLKHARMIISYGKFSLKHALSCSLHVANGI